MAEPRMQLVKRLGVAAPALRCGGSACATGSRRCLLRRAEIAAAAPRRPARLPTYFRSHPVPLTKVNALFDGPNRGFVSRETRHRTVLTTVAVCGKFWVKPRPVVDISARIARTCHASATGGRCLQGGPRHDRKAHRSCLRSVGGRFDCLAAEAPGRYSMTTVEGSVWRLDGVTGAMSVCGRKLDHWARERHRRCAGVEGGGRSPHPREPGAARQARQGGVRRRQRRPSPR